MKLKHGVYVGYIEEWNLEGCLVQEDKEDPNFVWCQFDNVTLYDLGFGWHKFSTEDIQIFREEEDARD